MPDALEFPRVLRAVVPLVRRERLAGLRRRVVDELVALALGHAVGRGGRLAGRRAGLVPGFAAVVGALDDLPEPAAGLRGVDPIRDRPASPSGGRSPSRRRCGPLTSHFWRLPSEVRMKAPLRVPTRTRIALIGCSLVFRVFEGRFGPNLTGLAAKAIVFCPQPAGGDSHVQFLGALR